MTYTKGHHFAKTDDSYDSLITDIVKEPTAVLPDRIHKALADTRSFDTLVELKGIDAEASALHTLLTGEITEDTFRDFDILVPTSNIKHNVQAILKRNRLKNFTRENYRAAILKYADPTARSYHNYPLEINQQKWLVKKPVYAYEKQLEKDAKTKKRSENTIITVEESQFDQFSNAPRYKHQKVNKLEQCKKDFNNDLENFRNAVEESVLSQPSIALNKTMIQRVESQTINSSIKQVNAQKKTVSMNVPKQPVVTKTIQPTDEQRKVEEWKAEQKKQTERANQNFHRMNAERDRIEAEKAKANSKNAFQRFFNM